MSHDSDSRFEEDLGDVERLLGKMEKPDPNSEFRADLKQAFVSGELKPSATAVEETLGGWGVGGASPEFRERLKRAFVSGDFRQAGGGRLPRLVRWSGLAAAAAILLAFLLPWGGTPADPALPWTAVDYEGTPFLSIDDREVAYADAAEISRQLASGGCCMATGENTVRLKYQHDLLLEMDEATRIDLDREEGNILIVDLMSGGVRISTGPNFKGSVRVMTPHAEIQLSGPSLGVDVMESGTCICCLMGKARVIPGDEGLEEFTVGSNSASFITAGEEPTVIHHTTTMHADELESLSVASDSHLY